MRKALANLENDHIQILRILDVMVVITASRNFNIGHLDTIVALIRNFALGVHHIKEENLLFPKLAEKGFLAEQETVSTILLEHKLCRDYVDGMANNITLLKSGNIGVLEEIYTIMLSYNELFRAHIDKEDAELFRTTDNLLTVKEQQTLLTEFKKVESKSVGGNSAKKSINQIDALERLYCIK